MDVFSRTFLPAAAEAGVAIPTVSRHMPIFRRCVESDDATVLVTRCLRPDRPLMGDFLLLLTNRRLVVTQETRVLHRLRLHLNADLRHLSNVTWNPDLRQPAVEVAATAVDGVRERFWMRLGDAQQVAHIDAVLQHVFRDRPAERIVRRTAAGRPTAQPAAARPTAAQPAAAHPTAAQQPAARQPLSRPVSPKQTAAQKRPSRSGLTTAAA
jgi:hypothetical protein